MQIRSLKLKARSCVAGAILVAIFQIGYLGLLAAGFFMTPTKFTVGTPVASGLTLLLTTSIVYGLLRHARDAENGTLR